MVNTRRTESSGLATDNGPRYRTRTTVPILGSSCESDSGGQGEEEESADEEDSWSSQGKPKVIAIKNNKPLVPPRVRELRNRFVCEERKFNPLNIFKRNLRSSRKLLAVNDRRPKLAVYSSHKMRDELESEDEYYNSHRHSRRNHYAKSHLSRLERRTALSLRPITRKSYKDDVDIATCNSDESDCTRDIAEVRRSTRKRSNGHSMSWLTDNQMHKVGYPNLDLDDEDSRDVEDHHTAGNHSTRSKNLSYLYSLKTEEMHSTRNGQVESHDKENKKDNNIISGRSKARRVKVEDKEETLQADSQSDINDTNAEVRNNQSKTPVCESGEENEKVNGKISKGVKREQENNVDDKNEDNEDEDNEEKAQEEEDDEHNSDENKPVEDMGETSESEDEIIKRRTSRRRRNNFPDTTGSKIIDSSSSSEVCRYSLRDRSKPKQSTITLRERSVHSRHRYTIRKISTDSRSNDSSDNEEMCRKNNKYSKNPKGQHSKNDQLKSGGNNVIPIGPDTLDPGINFSSVGGLDSHVQCLKEMILLPMIYPEIFKKFQIQPPRGVLFHGPPGTGKTLLARALANECSFGSKKVSFFMRKGADLLSKWIGESEKQLRLLFEEAAKRKPSIIFFDEVDGLAPVRSSRQDQIHASIVSTLLALMDGLDSRGEVIVVGATNRIDSIDPALRRPGRFDRELFFPLPARKEREEILRVHVSQWATPPNDQLISYLAESAVGYCGSDLRALCSEAVIQSFRRNYPQVYNSNHKLQVDSENVKVEKLDFLRAKSVLVPASHRVTVTIGRKLLPVLEPLLQEPLDHILKTLGRSFPHGLDQNLAKVKVSASVRPAQMLLLGNGYTHGQSYLAGAIMHTMEHIHSHILDLSSLHKEFGRSAEEACVQVFHEAKRNVPSIIYIPNIDLLWRLLSDTTLAIFVAQLIQLDPNSPILILATADSLYEDIPDQITNLFSRYRNEVYEIQVPDEDRRRNFFKPLIVDACLKPPKIPRDNMQSPPPLPRAPTPEPDALSESEAKKMYEKEESTMVELRIFLRDMCKKLASNRLFYMFTKPVDTKEVPDYTTIIKHPMDLETMMTKVDLHQYECAKDFLEDIELICHNALEYNPDRTSADKQIRHRACSLRDYAYALIKNEMDSDFEDKCQDISVQRRKRKVKTRDYIPRYLDKVCKNEIDESKQCEDSKPSYTPSRVGISKKRKMNSWCRGILSKRRKKSSPSNDMQNGDVNHELDDKTSEETENSKEADFGNNTEMSVEENLSPNLTEPLSVNCDTTTIHLKSIHTPNSRKLCDLMSPSELLGDPLDFDDVDQALNENSNSVEEQKVDINEEQLKAVLEKAVTITTDHALQSLLDLHFQLSRIVKEFIGLSNRSKLPKKLRKELKRYQGENNVDVVQPNKNNTTDC